MCRIARDYPHLIIYPAVVGSQDGPTKIQNVNSSKPNKIINEEEANNETKEINEQPNNSQENTNESLSTAASSQEEEEENSIGDQEGEEQENPELNENSIKENESETDDEEAILNEEEEDKKDQLKNTYKYLLGTLNDSNSKMIEQVKLFVHEMRRITLLREELWYGTLNQIHADINRRIDTLSTEITKLDSNQDLSDSEKAKLVKEKYSINKVIRKRCG